MAARKALNLEKGVRIAPPHPIKGGKRVKRWFYWMGYQLSRVNMNRLIRWLFYGSV